MGDQIPIILLSGMAADERLFESQLAIFPTLSVAPWIPPLPRESIHSYAARQAAIIDPGQRCLVGGASFGGVVALEIAPHLNAEACLLIGSIRSPGGLPWRWKLLLPIAYLGPAALRLLAALVSRFGSRFLSRGTVRQLVRLAQPESEFARWAICALLRWRPSRAARRLRVHHIHGAADTVLPISRAHPDIVVPDGTHALPMFNSEAVNAFLESVLREYSPKRSHQ
jgi:pimeloyl-ACP methyl ester carboxylesterase